jgi:hypothetical protein
VSAAGAGAHGGKALAGRAGPKGHAGLRARLQKEKRVVAGLGWNGRLGKFVFFFFYFLLNTQPIEFKQRFESKHSKTMHERECNREFLYFIN